MEQYIQDMASPIHKGRLYKRKAILSAASELFLSNGYTATNMDQIAEKANVSKQTIYSHFGNKEALFGEIIQGVCERSPCILQHPENLPNDVESALFQIADDFVKLILDEESILLVRLVYHEAPKNLALAETFLKEGPEETYKRLTFFFATLHEDGTLYIPEPYLAAKFFTGSLMSKIHLKALSGLPVKFGDTEVQEQISYAVKSFLAIHHLQP